MPKNSQPDFPNLTITGLFTFLEDKMTPEGLKDGWYELMTLARPLHFETEGKREYWKVERDGDEFNATPWDEQDV